MMLKTNLESVFETMGLDTEVEVYDIASIPSVISELDAIYTSAALVSQLEEVVGNTNVTVASVVNYFDMPHLEELTRKHLLK